MIEKKEANYKIGKQGINCELRHYEELLIVDHLSREKILTISGNFFFNIQGEPTFNGYIILLTSPSFTYVLENRLKAKCCLREPLFTFPYFE